MENGELGLTKTLAQARRIVVFNFSCSFFVVFRNWKTSKKWKEWRVSEQHWLFTTELRVRGEWERVLTPDHNITDNWLVTAAVMCDNSSMMKKVEILVIQSIKLSFILMGWDNRALKEKSLKLSWRHDTILLRERANSGQKLINPNNSSRLLLLCWFCPYWLLDCQFKRGCLSSFLWQ